MVTIIMNDYPKVKVSKLEYLWRKECVFVFPLVTSLLFHDSSWYFIVSNNATHGNPVHCVTKIGNIIIECLCWLIIKLTQLNLYSGDTSIQETFVSDPGCPLNRGPTVPKALNVCLHLYFENVM